MALEYKPAKQFEPYLTPPLDKNVESQDLHTQRLIWHLCHLCNVTTSSLSVYLSLEALARETSAHGTLNNTFVAYHPAMRAQALMLKDICLNLEANRNALVLLPFHRDYLLRGSYRSLIYASSTIPEVISLIPESLAPILDAARLTQQCLPSKDVVMQIRKCVDELNELCVGNASKGIEGWKACWHDVGSKIAVY